MEQRIRRQKGDEVHISILFIVDTVSPEKRSDIMSRIRGKNTTSELWLRKALWKAGLRYRKHYEKHHIDIAFPRKKVAVFVDGCFWHGCPVHGKIPESNRDYWLPKLERNIERDRVITKALEAEGWTVIRVWEHELKDLEAIVLKITKEICCKAYDPSQSG